MTSDELEILFEDNHIIVVMKPQNVPSCEDVTKDPDMLNIIKDYIKKTYEKPGNVFLGLVHRLDRPTGGIMVFAKTTKAASRLSEQIREGDFEKKYLAVLIGCPEEREKTLVNYLKKNSITNSVYLSAQTVDGAKRAELYYRILEDKRSYSLAEVFLRTGRSHQIRVQLSGIGVPVFGDQKYGGEKAKKGKLALWAYHLKFTHPVTKERLVFLLEPPRADIPWKAFDIENVVSLIGK